METRNRTFWTLSHTMSLINCRLKEDRLRFTYNLEVQLLLKQGQVEVDGGPFIHDYRDSLLLHRSGVEDLNAKIRVSTTFLNETYITILTLFHKERTNIFLTHHSRFFLSPQQLGESKINSMVESKDFRKSIVQLEWLVTFDIFE